MNRREVLQHVALLMGGALSAPAVLGVLNGCSRRPGTSAPLVLDVDQTLNTSGLEAYERLLRDVMLGDQLLFTRAHEIEQLWACAQPLLDDPPEVHPYAQGSWGPDAALALAGPAGWALPQAEALLPA